MVANELVLSFQCLSKRQKNMKRACSTGLPIRCAFKQILLVRKKIAWIKKLRVWFEANHSLSRRVPAFLAGNP